VADKGQISIFSRNQGRRQEARPYWQMALKLERDPRAVGAIQQRLRQPD